MRLKTYLAVSVHRGPLFIANIERMRNSAKDVENGRHVRFLRHHCRRKNWVQSPNVPQILLITSRKWYQIQVQHVYNHAHSFIHSSYVLICHSHCHIIYGKGGQLLSLYDRLFFLKMVRDRSTQILTSNLSFFIQVRINVKFVSCWLASSINRFAVDLLATPNIWYGVQLTNISDRGGGYPIFSLRMRSLLFFFSCD